MQRWLTTKSNAPDSTMDEILEYFTPGGASLVMEQYLQSSHYSVTAVSVPGVGMVGFRLQSVEPRTKLLFWLRVYKRPHVHPHIFLPTPFLSNASGVQIPPRGLAT